MNEEVLIPLVVFGSIAAISYFAFHFSYKKRMVVYEAIRVAIEKTGNADPQLIDAIVRENVGRFADLRRGIVLVAVAIAFMTLGYVIPEEDVFRPMLGVAAFPGLIGIAYISFHFFAPREPTV